MTIKHAVSMMANSAALRQAVKKWKSDLPASDRVAIKTLDAVRQSTADSLDNQADKWVLENKLVHAGAARKLAAELREKLL